MKLGLKRSFSGAAILLTLSAATAGLAFKIGGPISREVACDPSNQPEGLICLETVKSWAPENVFWIDARKRSEFEKGHHPGAFLFNNEAAEDFAAMEAEFMGIQAVDPKPHVVIYCDSEACGSSKQVATHLRQNFADPLGFKVHVLTGGWKALNTIQ